MVSEWCLKTSEPSKLLRVSPAGVLVAKRLVEGMGVGTPVGGVEDEVDTASRSRLVLERFHQRLADATATEMLAHDEPGDLAARLVALDEVLHMQRAESGDLAVDVGDDKPRGRITGDPVDALGGLLLGRWIAELAEKHGNRSRVSTLGCAKRYGGGGPPGGASSSTYVVLLRPHPPP